jgi:hypothetical protein
MRKIEMLIALGAAGLFVSAAPAQTLSVTSRGSTTLAGTTTDQNGNSFTITGLSGITYTGLSSPGIYRYIAVMDNSNKLVKLDVQFNANGSISSSTVVGGITLANSNDYEGIAYNAANQSVFVSYENGPGIQEYKLSDGTLLQTVAIPSIYTNNLRSNFGFESLARNAAGTQMWTANEEALTSDGALSTTSTGSIVRLQKFNVSGNTVTAGPEYGYLTNKIHAAVNGDNSGYSRSGLSDLVVLPDGKMLALERSFAYNNAIFSTYGNRIYEMDFTGAADVSGLAGANNGQPFGSYVNKYQLWTNQSLTNPGNLEGLTSGPFLTGGNLSLLGIVDDGDGVSQNRLVAFELTGVAVPEPSSMGLLGGILMAQLMHRRR